MDNSIKDSIIKLLRSTERPGIENLISYMENESDFFAAPASTHYHGCKEGALAEHSLVVWDFMQSIYSSGAISLFTGDTNSMIIVSLLHDLGKATYHGKPNYVPNYLKGGKISEAKPYEVNKDRLSIPHELASIQIASRFIELTEEEEFAIFFHNGLYVGSGRDVNGKERPLQLLLHFCDMWASRFIEEEG